jgi:site-specific DNA-methyltransferase (adenine-specific)
MEKLSVDYIPVSEIVPYEKNPRKNDKAVDIVTKSIKEFGFNVPILLDKNNVIIAGHTRLKAAMKLGMNEVPVIWLEDLTEEQAKAFRIMDNKSIEYATWDIDLLKGEFAELKDKGFDLDLTGFNEVELNRLMPNDFEEGELPNPEVPKYSIQRGNIYQLGNHRLMCGDSTIREDVDKLMNNAQANMILIDPPYGVNYSEKNTFLNSISPGNRNQTPIENDSNVDIRALICDFLNLSKLTDYNTIYIFSRGKNIANMIYAFQDADCYYSQDLKWIKNNHVLGRLDYNPKSENILYGWKGKHEFYGGFQTDVLFFDKPLISKEHPTMKPVDLLSTLITHGSRENGIVYDGFGGSGSTLIACERSNRKCFMMEIDPKYCSVIIERWEKLTGKTAVKMT